jgi:hypothetical protein
MEVAASQCRVVSDSIVACVVHAHFNRPLVVSLGAGSGGSDQEAYQLYADLAEAAKGWRGG